MDQDKIRNHFDSDKMTQNRIYHQQDISRLKTELETLRTSVNKVIEALGPDAYSKDIRAFFDDKSEQIHQSQLDLARHRRELAKTTIPRSLDHIVLTSSRIDHKIAHLVTTPKSREATTPHHRQADNSNILES